MKILYISAGTHPDYMCDMAFHGLRSLYGASVVDSARLGYLYKTDAVAPSGNTGKKFFSLYNLLPEDRDVDRADLESKIKSRFFDLVIYGSIWRCTTFSEIVLQSYPANRIVFIDGEDVHEPQPNLMHRALGKGWYFKRELLDRHPGVFPIGFGIPKEKVVLGPFDKTRLVAHIDPRDTSTYIYDSEAAYYEGYRTSYFEITKAKGGWDCMRHYEILANATLPLFLDAQAMPATVMVHWPRQAQVRILELMGKHTADWWTGAGRGVYNELLSEFQHALLNHMTTEAVAKDLLAQVAKG